MNILMQEQFEVDDILVDSMMKLSKKGYRPLHYCSSKGIPKTIVIHDDESVRMFGIEIYLLNLNIMGTVKNEPPINWETSIDDKYVYGIIRFFSDEEIKLHTSNEWLHKVNNELNSWINNLEYISTPSMKFDIYKSSLV